MATSSWNSENLIKPDEILSFYQLLRLVDPIKILAETDQAFPTTDARIVKSSAESIQIQQNLFSLIGQNGILPDHYWEHLQQQLQLKDYGLKDFLDIFNHVIAMQFYKAWASSEFFIAYEKSTSISECHDYTIQFSLALLGLGPNLPDYIRQLFLYHAANMINSVKTREGLNVILRRFFELPIEIEEFVGTWLNIPIESQSRLFSQQQFNQLGTNCILGCRAWSLQDRFKINIGPMNYLEFVQLFDQPKKMIMLKQIVQNYCGNELNFNTVIEVDYLTIPHCYLHGDIFRRHSQLGWNTWLKTKNYPNKNASVIFH